MLSLDNIKKTKRYKDRKEYNESNPENQVHIDMTNLIDDLIKVAIHIKKISDAHSNRNADRDFSFKQYVDAYGIMASGNGLLQTNGFYIDGEKRPFVEWANEEQTKYNIYHNNLLTDIFNNVYHKGISPDKIVDLVETTDMWYNC